MYSNNLAGTEISSNKSAGTGQSESLAEIGKDLAACNWWTYKMNELEEVEGTNKKISKQQGLKSSNSKQQGSIRADLTWQHATGKGSSIEKT